MIIKNAEISRLKIVKSAEISGLKLAKSAKISRYKGKIMAKAIPAPFTKGVNFTHWLHFWHNTETAKDLVCTKQEMTDAKSLGCDVIRFPIFFEGDCSDDGKYTVKPYVFELMNEPHGIKIELWNEIIGRVFRLVRSIDKRHYIICVGADWNSFDALCTLPDFLW